MRHPALKWTALENTGQDRLHQWHVARDVSGTVYKIRPIYYSGKTRRFAGYRVQVGNLAVRGFKTMLIDAKASAQRFANRKNSTGIKKIRAHTRVLDFDIETVEIDVPQMIGRMIDL